MGFHESISVIITLAFYLVTQDGKTGAGMVVVGCRVDKKIHSSELVILMEVKQN